jgi:autophagy-related protein 9
MSFLFQKKVKGDKKVNKNNDFFSESLLISDLDKFFNQIYIYYYKGGYRCMSTQIYLDNIIYLFTIHFLMFILFFIEWNKLISPETKTLENIELSNFISSKYFYNHKYLAYGFYFLLMNYYLYFFFSSLNKISSLKRIYQIYHHKLHLRTKNLESLYFDDIIKLLIILQEKEGYCRIKDNLTKYDIIARINRRENYIIAMISNKIISFQLFGINLFSNYILDYVKNNFMKFMIKDKEVEINKNFYNPNFFRIKILIQIIIQVITIPSEIIFRIIFFLFKNADNLKTIDKITRNKWTNDIIYQFKNYNECKHHLENRINKSYRPTETFLSCFKQKMFSIIGKTFVLICGSFFLLFLILTLFVDIKVTNISIFGYNFLLFIMIIGILMGIFNNSNVNNENNTLENFPFKLKQYKEMCSNIINVPSDWNKNEIYRNYQIISTNYKNNIILFIHELLSIILFPVLWFKLFWNYQLIIDFVKNNSVNIPGLGTVCSLSVLNTNSYIVNNERNTEYFLTNEQKRFNDAKFINSIIYYEKNFLNENKNNNINNSNNNDDKENDEMYSNVNEDVSLKINENKENKTKKINKSTEECVWEVYSKNKKLSKEDEKEFYKNIYYYITSYNGLNLTQVIEKMYSEKINHIII